MLQAELEEMRRVNLRQGSYYDEMARRPIGNAREDWWSSARNMVRAFRREAGIDQLLASTHLEWLGDISRANVLEIGCYTGSALTLTVASRASRYLGIDLSSAAVSSLNATLREHGLTRATAACHDFLDAQFVQADFDVIYAHGVLHHFRHFEALLQRLKSKLAPQGRVVCFEPLNTSAPIRWAREVRRPHQIDRDWEWPFTRQHFEALQEHFDVVAVQGLLGWSKWAVPFVLAPGRARPATRWMVRRLHGRDLAKATRIGPDLWRCMWVLLHLQRKA